MPSQKCCQPTYFPDRADIQQDSKAAGAALPDYTGPEFKLGIPGSLVTVSGDETYRGRQLEAHLTHVYECRWFNGVTATMRLKMTTGIYKDRILNIRAVKPVRKQGTPPMQWLYCEEEAAV